LQLALTIKIFKNNKIETEQKKVKMQGGTCEKHDDIPREERSIEALKRRRMRCAVVARTEDLRSSGTAC
jgi:hypothetical protein